jgi:hypothetical protein
MQTKKMEILLLRQRSFCNPLENAMPSVLSLILTLLLFWLHRYSILKKEVFTPLPFHNQSDIRYVEVYKWIA